MLTELCESHPELLVVLSSSPPRARARARARASISRLRGTMRYDVPTINPAGYSYRESDSSCQPLVRSAIETLLLGHKY